MNPDEVPMAYYVWLRGFVHSGVANSRYDPILTYIHSREFYSLIPNDDNRLKDGLALRYLFEMETGLRDIERILVSPCSVLEMIIGVAKHMEFIRSSELHDEFWEMLDNLGLRTDPGAVQLNLIVSRLVDRTYSPTGKGSLFPMKRFKPDMREIEIWYQMMEYIKEN